MYEKKIQFMKYLKLFENKMLETEIIDFLEEITDNNWDCPFADELMVIHEKEHVDSLFWSFDGAKGTLGEFRIIYSKMVKDAEKKIIEYLIEDPDLYFWVKNYETYIDIPDWIKQANKYNV